MNHLLTVLLLLFCSCAPLQQAPDVPHMNQTQYEVWVSEVTNPIVFLAMAGLDEGDLTKEQVEDAVVALRKISEAEVGSVALGLLNALELKGYWKAAGMMLFAKLDNELKRQGLASNVSISPRYREAMGILADRLEELIK